MDTATKRLYDRTFSLINKRGATGVFSAAPVPDPATGGATASTVTWKRKMIPPTPRREFNADSSHESRFMRSGVAAKGLEFTPTIGMRVVLGGNTWHIVAVDESISGDTTILYEFDLN
jgi:hypothetical protein